LIPEISSERHQSNGSLARRSNPPTKYSMDVSLSPSTWRVLGLWVATSYIGLGTMAITAPVFAAKCFGIYPDLPPSSHSPSNAKHQQTDRDKENHADAVSTSMKLLGARDLSIGLALVALDYQGHQRPVGTLILSSFVLCVVDVYEVWKRRGSGWGAAFAAGAAVWMAIGWGIVTS